MTNEIILGGQIVSIVAFLGVALSLYKQLVSVKEAALSLKDAAISAKDATIETLQQQNSALEARVEELQETAPDVLLKRVVERTQLLEIELKRADEERAPLVKEVETLKEKLVMYDESSQSKKAIIDELVTSVSHIAALDAQEEQITQSWILNTSNTYQAFFAAHRPTNALLILKQVVDILGPKLVAEADDNELRGTFRRHLPQFHPDSWTLMVEQLRRSGYVDEQGDMTVNGIRRMRSIGRSTQSDSTFELE